MQRAGCNADDRELRSFNFDADFTDFLGHNISAPRPKVGHCRHHDTILEEAALLTGSISSFHSMLVASSGADPFGGCGV